MDSGGFTELSTHGCWTTTAREYARDAKRIADEVGRCVFAAQQDWMTEPWILDRTGFNVREHQRRTVDNLLELRALQPSMRWLPVLQGWTLGDYLNHLEEFDRAGVDLREEVAVGIGSVCRRQRVTRPTHIAMILHAEGLRLHGFGIKVSGLRWMAPLLSSADSMAWSFAARKDAQAGRAPSNARNSFSHALVWRDNILSQLYASDEYRMRYQVEVV